MATENKSHQLGTPTPKRARALESSKYRKGADASSNTAATLSDQVGINAAANGFMMAPRPFNLTLPPPDDFYFVREEQLEDMEGMGKSRSLDLALAFLGVFLGYVPNGLETLRNIWNSGTTSLWDVALLMLAASALAIGISKFLQHKREAKAATNLVEKIKSGQKMKVGHDQ